MPNRPNIEEGNGRFQVPELKNGADYYLLNGNQRKEMCWGISRYISEQPLNRMDIEASVESSAKAGLPEIVFLNALEERSQTMSAEPTTVMAVIANAFIIVSVVRYLSFSLLIFELRFVFSDKTEQQIRQATMVRHG